MTAQLPTWERYLKGDPDREFMLELFRPGGGLPIVGHDVTVPPSRVANYSSVRECYAFMDAQIREEISAGFVVEVPFTPRKLNALGAVSKGPGKWRRITDLSKPEGSQLNLFTDPIHFQFASVDDAVYIIRRYAHIRLSKFDIKNAFRHVPVRPEHWDLQGFEWDEKLYIDLRMCFGLSIAPYVFWRISNFITKVASAHYSVRHVIPYMDDFLIISTGNSEMEADVNATADFANFRHCLRDIGFSINEAKVVPPSLVVTFLGIVIDTVKRNLSVPTEKLNDILLHLNSFANKRKARKREVEKLVGRLNFAAKVVRGGRTFLRRMIDVVNSRVSHNAQVHLNASFREDVQWWLKFASSWNGLAVMLVSSPINRNRLMVDASGAASAAIFDSSFIIRPHNSRTSQWHINDQELLSIYLAALMWAPEWRDHHVIVASDNTTAVASINKGSSKSPVIMRMLRDLFWISAKFNFHLIAEFIPGLQNTLADAASRLKLEPLISEGLSMLPCPEIPDHVTDG